MTELHGDEYGFVPADEGRLISGRVRRLAGAAVFLAMIGGMGLWAYRLGTRDAAEVPIIRAMEGPARVQPAEPGGLRAAHQGLEVNTVLAGQSAPEAGIGAGVGAKAGIAADPAGILAQEDGPQGELVIAPPPVLAAEALAAGEDLPMPPSEETEGAEVALIEAPTAVEAMDPANSAAVVAEALGADLPAEALGADLAAAALGAGPSAEALAGLEGAEAGTRPLRRPADLVLARAAPPPAPVLAIARPGETAEAERDGAAEASAGGGRMVQLGAFDSEAIARQAWNILASTNRDLLASRNVVVERTTANARVFYRLRAAGFSSQAEAQEMCAALRARKVDCIPLQRP